MLTAEHELAMADAVVRQGSTMPGGQPPGMVLVAAILTHKDGPPPRRGPDKRVKYVPGQQYWMTEPRAVVNEQRGLVYRVGSCSHDWWGAPGRVLSPWREDTEQPFATAPSPGALKIMQGCGYDPGSQAYRFHSALSYTKHVSAFARWGDSNPHCSLRQLDGERDAAKVRQAVLDADVLHCHVAYYLLNNTGLAVQPHQVLVRHYHGSHPTAGMTHVQADFDLARGALLVGARLSFQRDAALWSAKLGHEVVIHWLPITVPVARYQQLRQVERLHRTPTATDPYLVAHAPTKRAWKGTSNFLRAVTRLQSKGLPIKALLIEKLDQRQALERKAKADCTFDSFWLGLQTSGLEGAAMGQPVVAGDPDVRKLYEAEIGYCPYTYANDEPTLTQMLERLVVDVDFRTAEAQRVRSYCLAYHDYPAVARRYEELLSQRLGRSDVLTVTNEAAAA
jgi:hypothetical protein